MKLLEEQIAELLAKAENADSTPLHDGLSIPAEIERREERIQKLKQATAVIEARAAERSREERLKYERKLEERERKQSETGQPPGEKLPNRQRKAPRQRINITSPIRKAGS